MTNTNTGHFTYALHLFKNMSYLKHAPWGDRPFAITRFKLLAVTLMETKKDSKTESFYAITFFVQ